MEEQESLTKQMINECLPKVKYNWKVNYPQSLGKNVAGDTEYHENDFQEAELFKKRHREELIDKGYFRMVDKLITNHKGQQ